MRKTFVIWCAALVVFTGCERSYSKHHIEVVPDSTMVVISSTRISHNPNWSVYVTEVVAKDGNPYIIFTSSTGGIWVVRP